MNDSLIVRTVKQILSWQVEPFSNASRRRSHLKVAHSRAERDDLKFAVGLLSTGYPQFPQSANR